MVQKKVPILQTDYVKFKKLLKNLRPSSSFQHQESSMMNRGTDMKIMKKQRQNLCSPSFRKQISQPGKPPPPSMAATSSSSSKMKSLIKISEKKPNYMKPTTSSDARKENSQPNFKNLETSSKKNGKSPSKMVSALTKTTSFKPTRTATKKSYPFVENVQKPTCSSTLKDSKFPDFLTLNSGGTESEGTSIMKVCSYTYCSLNGLHHHHPPLPPLKSFLSARRHMMKTQRNIKMGSLSPPRRSREKRDAIVEENETLQVSFVGKFLNEEYDEFFIQIYSKESEAGGDRDETVKELEPSYLLLEIDHRESCNENNDTNHSDTDSADYFLEDNPIKNDASEFFDPEINTMEGLENQENQEDEEKNTEINMEDIQGFSPFEMEGHTALYLDDHNPEEIENEYFEELKLSEMLGEFIDEETITGSDTDLDHDFEIDETIEISNMQGDEEIDESGIYKYDESDKFVKIDVDNEEVLKEDDNQELKKDYAVDNYYQLSDQKFETEDDNQELKKQNAVDDYYPPSDLKSETKDDNQELKKQNAVDDYYPPSDQKSETEDDNQELKKQNAVDDYYQLSDLKSETKDDNQELKKQNAVDDYYPPSDQNSETEDDNQELQKQSAIGDHYQLSDQKSESQDDNQETKKDIAIDDHYQPTDQKSESDYIENLEKTDESIALCTDSQSNLTKNICPAFKKMHTIDIDEDVSKNCKIGKWIYKQKESISEENDLKGFNPRGPNFLEAEPDPESEKVDLKHQMIDDRRNSEEWMLDYALQQAVNKLAVARKKKVTLLVEAFETVSPLPKWEKTRMGVGFDLQHRIQACR